MAAFRPANAANNASALHPDRDPTTREEFLEMFGEETVRQAERIVMDAIDQVHRSRAYFRERDIIRAALRMAEKEVPEKILGHAHFKTLLEASFRVLPMVALDQRGTLTTPGMWERERTMLAMAGEETRDHILPEKIVDQALATRSWIAAKDLPPELAMAAASLAPGQDGDFLQVRCVVQAAQQMGYEVYGPGMTWNRPGATGMADDLVGQPEEFVQAIDEAAAEGESWFIKPVLFIGDDWTTPQARALAERAKASPHPVVVASRAGISDEQVDAVIAATLLDRRITVIEGTAGAGKSFTMKSVYEAYMAQGYDVMGAALGWSAAKVLSGSTGLPEKSCRALAGFLNSMKRANARGTQFFTRPSLVIIDEAGMVGNHFMADLLELTRNSRYPVKIVLTGDSLQVAPVDAGNAMEAIISFHGTTRIETIRRQKQESHRTAVFRFSRKQSGKALYPLVHQEAIRWSQDREDMFNKVVQDFVSYRAAFPEKKALVLALKNEDVTELNRRIRMVYKKAGFIEANEVMLEVTDGRAKWRAGFSIGDEVVLRANDQNLPIYYIPEPGQGDLYDESTWEFKTTGVFNRNSGRVVGIRRSKNPPGSYDFIIDLEGDDPARVVVNSQAFKHENSSGMPMVHNFATTIYASQGQTVPKVMLIDSDRMNFRLAYVGASRHTDSVDIYVNETDLHLRLDQMLGKSPSRPIDPSNIDNVAVELGRYSRSEMLQTVALAWGQDSDNLSATIYEQRARLEYQPNVFGSHSDRAKIEPGEPGEPVVDFIPSVNVSYPMVDIEKVLQLPDPVGEVEFVRPSDVEENRKAVPTYESPVRLRAESHLPTLPTQEAEGTGLLSKATQWLGRHLAHPHPSTPPAPPAPRAGGALAAGHDKPASPFSKASGRTAGSRAALELEPGMLGRVADFLASVTPKPRGVPTLPFLPAPEPLGHVDAAGVLRFDGVPQTQAPEGVDIPSPSDAFLTSPQGQLWWAVGRGGAPRILARSHRGHVVARYSLDGKCLVGDGFPPIAFAPGGSSQAPVHIVPGPREWFLLQELYRERFKDAPEKMPHVVWGARDVDWKQVAAGLKGREVVILRSKYDQGQIPWAQDLHRELTTRWGLDVAVAPRIPTLAPAPAPRSPRRGP